MHYGLNEECVLAHILLGLLRFVWDQGIIIIWILGLLPNYEEYTVYYHDGYDEEDDEYDFGRES